MLLLLFNNTSNTKLPILQQNIILLDKIILFLLQILLILYLLQILLILLNN